MYTNESLEQDMKSLSKTNKVDFALFIRPLIPSIIKTLESDEKLVGCSLSCQENGKSGFLLLFQNRIIFQEKFLARRRTEIYLKNIAAFENNTIPIPFFSYDLCNIKITDAGGNKYYFTNLLDSDASRIIKVLNEQTINQKTI